MPRPSRKLATDINAQLPSEASSEAAVFDTNKGNLTIAKNKNQNTYEKRAREMEKKRKAEEKRSRRQQRKTDSNQEEGKSS